MNAQPGFLCLRDVNYVSSLINLRYVVSVTLVHAGLGGDLLPGQEEYVPIIAISLADGSLINHVCVPTVPRRERTRETAEKAWLEFVARLVDTPALPRLADHLAVPVRRD